MSSDLSDPDQPLLICEFCGFKTEELDQQCTALDNGRCRRKPVGESPIVPPIVLQLRRTQTYGEITTLLL